MTTNAKIQTATTLVAYLLRGLWTRIDHDRIGRDRRRDLPRELADALLPIAVSERSSLGFIRAVCARFEIDVTECSRFDSAAFAQVPRQFVPSSLLASFPEDMAVIPIRWDVACSAIDFEALRISIHDKSALFATFATMPPAVGEEMVFSPAGVEVEAIPWTATLPGRMVSPRAFRTVWTQLSNLAHGHDEKHGNVILFRRERAVSPVTGAQYLSPFLAGNAIRGMWRDQIFGRLFQLLQIHSSDLPPQRAHALLAGGSIEAGADSAGVNIPVRRDARAKCPAWDLLAGCIDQQIMRGLIRVHDATLVCRENAWKLHGVLAPEVDGRKLTIEEFTAALRPADDLTQLRLATRHAHRDLPGSDGSQMIFNTEVILAGAQWAHSFQLIGLDGVSDLAKSCMADLLSEFRDDALAGAGNARGFGRIAFDPYQPGEGEADLPSPAIYRAWVADHADAIRAWLLGASSPVETTTKPGRSKAGKVTAVPHDAATGEVVPHVPTEIAHQAGGL